MKSQVDVMRRVIKENGWETEEALALCNEVVAQNQASKNPETMADEALMEEILSQVMQVMQGAEEAQFPERLYVLLMCRIAHEAMDRVRIFTK